MQTIRLSSSQNPTNQSWKVDITLTVKSKYEQNSLPRKLHSFQPILWHFSGSFSSNGSKVDEVCSKGSYSFIIINNLLSARVVEAPQVILQPVFSIFPCSPLPFGTCRIPGLSISWCCLPTSSSVCLAFFPFSLAMFSRLSNINFQQSRP